MDGATVETKEVALAAGASKTVSFSLVKDKAGTYQVGIGGLTSSLKVKAKLVVKEVELKYDDGEARAFGYSFGFSGAIGYIVDFSPPATPFTIKKIRVAGAIYSQGAGFEKISFDLQILDKNGTVLHSTTYPCTKFPVNAIVNTWTEFEVPDIKVTDKFYVDVLVSYPTGFSTTPLVGVDDSVVNQHSNFATRTAEGKVVILAQWLFSGQEWWADKSKVNWMIRVVGTGMMPES